MMSSGSKTDTADRTSEFGARNSEFGISSESRSADAAASREGVRPRHLVSNLRLLFAKLSLSSALGTPNSALRIPRSEFRMVYRPLVRPPARSSDRTGRLHRRPDRTRRLSAPRRRPRFQAG